MSILIPKSINIEGNEKNVKIKKAFRTGGGLDNDSFMSAVRTGG